MKLQFEWDEAKARKNWRIHRVSFELASSVFKDAFAVEFQDDREDYGEPRYVIIGIARDHSLIVVVYTERDGRIRIISARSATRDEEDEYYRQNSRPL